MQCIITLQQKQIMKVLDQLMSTGVVKRRRLQTKEARSD